MTNDAAHQATTPPPRGRIWTAGNRAFSGWNVLGTLTFISGIAIGAGVPIWQEAAQKPVVSIEMNSILRQISPQAKIAIDEYPELSAIRNNASLITRRTLSYLSLNLEGPQSLDISKQNIVSLDQLAEILAAAKREAQELPGRVDQAQRDLDQAKALKAEDMTPAAIARMNSFLLPEIDVDTHELNTNRQNVSANVSYFDDLRQEFINAFENRLKPLIRAYPVDTQGHNGLCHAALRLSSTRGAALRPRCRILMAEFTSLSWPAPHPPHTHCLSFRPA